MDIALGQAKFVTTVQIPMKLRQEIKAAGYTMNGVITAGFNALMKENELRQDIRDLQANMDKYRSSYVRVRARLDQLEQAGAQGDKTQSSQ